MNENNAILNLSNAASRFCETYNEFGTSLDKIGSEIAQLEKQMGEKAKKYNVNAKIVDFFSDNSITAESLYNSLNGAEKYHDDNGNIVDFGLLTDAERAALEEQAKQMNAEQGDVKLELVTMRAEIDKKTAMFERFIFQYKEKLRISKENFENEQKYLANQKSLIDNQIKGYEFEKQRIKYAPEGSFTNKSTIISDYNRQISLANVKLAIINSVSRLSDVYMTVFESIHSNISEDMYDKDETFSLEEQFREEMSIADRIRDLVNGFAVIKENYSKDKEKIEEIKKSINEFKNNYQNMANANTFINKANSAVNELKDAIKHIEENNDVKKAKVDENGDVLTNPVGPQAPTGPETQEPTPGKEEPTGPETPAGPETEVPTPGKEEPTGPQAPTKPETPAGPEKEVPIPGKEEPTGPQVPTGPEGTSEIPNNLKEVMKEAKRAKSVHRMRNRRGKQATLALAAAAAGLGFIPPLAPVSSVLFAIAAAGGLANVGMQVGEPIVEFVLNAKYKATSKKLNNIANAVTKAYNKNNKKSGISFRVRTNAENGMIRFGIVKDGEDIGLIDSRSTGIVIGDGYSLNQAEVGSIVSLFNDELDKAFPKINSENRDSFYEKYNFPKVTVDNLPILYAQFGGYDFNLEGDQFGMMDLKEAKKAKKEKRSLLDRFKSFGQRFKRGNKTTEDELEDLAERDVSAMTDGSSEGSAVNDEELDGLDIPTGFEEKQEKVQEQSAPVETAKEENPEVKTGDEIPDAYTDLANEMSANSERQNINYNDPNAGILHNLLSSSFGEEAATKFASQYDQLNEEQKNIFLNEIYSGKVASPEDLEEVMNSINEPKARSL